MPSKIQGDESFLIALDPTRLNEFAKKFAEFLQKPRIIGQERLQEAAIRSVSRFDSRIRRKNAPVYSILAIGPSGVGKTRIFELCAEFLFGNENGLTKLSGPEYFEEHAISKLIGSPPGYVGSNVDERGPFPMLSQWNIGKHYYFQMLRELAQKSEQQSALQPTRKDLENLLFHLESDEDQLSRRIIVFADTIASLRSYPAKKTSAEHKAIQETIKTYQQYIYRVSASLLMIYTQIDSIVLKLSMMHQHDLAFNPQKHKRGIILADEIDKASVPFMNIFYEILDRARITLQNGTITDCSEIILGMTSNKGAKEMEDIIRGEDRIGIKPAKKPIDAGTKDKKLYKVARESIKKILPAPMRGRIDEIVVTHELSHEQIRNIIKLIEIPNLQELLAQPELAITLDVDNDVVDFLWRESLDKPEEGARLPKKKVKHYLEDPISTFDQTKQLKPGDRIIVRMNTANDEPQLVFAADTSRRKAAKEDILKTKEAIEKIIRGS